MFKRRLLLAKMYRFIYGYTKLENQKELNTKNWSNNDIKELLFITLV